MGDKDPSPFGYSFSGFLDHEYDANHSLLTDVESQSIADFFTNTDPFHLAEPQQYHQPADTKDTIDGFNNWANFVHPATVHGVSTTIPDQSHLQNNFYNDHNYAQPPPPPPAPAPAATHLVNTHDDLQAASTLFQNSQSSYAHNRSHSFHTPANRDQPSAANESTTVDSSGKPLRITPHGLINEQLAALIPNHNQEGTLDAQFAAQWIGTNAMQMYEHEIERPNLKRSYTFGTDESFNNPSGYNGPPGQETSDQVTRRLMRDMRHSQASLHAGLSNGNGKTNEVSDDEQSDEATSDEDEDEKPSKRRRKSKVAKDSQRKGARNGKGRKASAADEGGKKRRSAAAQKLQRENLTEEQKRSNHILSEQKRRNLIKRGFDDLHDLVPEIRNGGLSKSSVLTEAGNFLEKLIDDNKTFKKLIGG